MRQRFRAAFIRGGTSKALMFREEDLPCEKKLWDGIFLRAMGSPDNYGRQLNGMGGGLSSLSKVCIVGPASVPDADVDYTFVQVMIKEAKVDYSGNCGNMSSAIGPFAVDEGLVHVPKDGEACVRIHNTNTRKIIHARFQVKNGKSVEAGDLLIPGVDAHGAPVRLDFLNPGGASTGQLLPTGTVQDTLDIPGVGSVLVSLIDAANACVFVPASAIGLKGTESPDQLSSQPQILKLLSDLRLRGSMSMGISNSLEHASSISLIPLIAIVSSPQDSTTLDGETIRADQADLVVRMISNGQPHRALPLTGSVCTAVAMQITGTVVNVLARAERDPATVRLAMPSGVLTVTANVQNAGGRWHAASGSFFRTTRRLFDGFVYA